jgi:hypothetical protein
MASYHVKSYFSPPWNTAVAPFIGRYNNTGKREMREDTLDVCVWTKRRMCLGQLSKSTYVSGWLDRARTESRSWDLPDTKHSCYPVRLWLQMQGFCLNLKSSTGTSSCLFKITCANVWSAWCPTWRIATNLVINKHKLHQPKILRLIFYNSYRSSELRTTSKSVAVYCKSSILFSVCCKFLPQWTIIRPYTEI